MDDAEIAQRGKIPRPSRTAQQKGHPTRNALHHTFSHSYGRNGSRAPRDQHSRAPFSPTGALSTSRRPFQQPRDLHRRAPFLHQCPSAHAAVTDYAPRATSTAGRPFHQQHTSSAFRFLSARCCRTLSCPHTARNLPALLRCEEAGCTSQRGQSDRVRPF